MNNFDYELILNMIESDELMRKVEDTIKEKFKGKRLTEYQICGSNCVTPQDIKAEVNRILMEGIK